MSSNGTLHSALALTRRDALVAGSALAAALTLPGAAFAASSHTKTNGVTPMPFVKTKDGTEIFYRDWGPKDAQPVVFSHGWPLSGDTWAAQMLFLGMKGYRVIAHDRRGHGYSSQPWTGNDMDHYADDMAAVIDHLGLKNAVLVGHSTGGGEIAHYVGRHGTSKVAKMVFVSAVPPLMLKTETNPEGTPLEVFDGIRKSTAEDRSQFFLDITMPFYGFNREGAKVNEGLRYDFWRLGMMGSIKGEYDCVHEFSEVDYTDDLKKIDKPTLVIHGSDDQIVPIAAAGEKTAKIVKGAELKVYEGAPHGLYQTMGERFNEDLLAFIKA